MMSEHTNPKTVMRYDRGRENRDQNAVSFLRYDEECFFIMCRTNFYRPPMGFIGAFDGAGMYRPGRARSVVNRRG